jgi:hypothetical protein
MATTTTNFGWDIPQSTDLVKDGATAIAALGQDIDTALVDLKGGTTGQVLAKASGTDLDFSWVAQDDSNAIQNAIVDAKGDLIAASAADTPARLAVGTNGQILTADSTAATGLAWATAASGGMTLLSTTTLSGAGTTISSISGSYTNLQIFVIGVNAATNGQFLQMNCNSATNLTNSNIFDPDSTGASKTYDNITASPFWLTYNSAMLNADTSNAFTINIENYASTTAFKSISSNSTWITSGTTRRFGNANGFFNSTTAISSIQFRMIQGGTVSNFNGGTVLIYGVK